MSAKRLAIPLLLSFIVACTPPPRDRHITLVHEAFPPDAGNNIKVMLLAPLEGIELGHHPRLLFKDVPAAQDNPEAYVLCTWSRGMEYVLNENTKRLDFYSAIDNRPLSLPPSSSWIQKGRGSHGLEVFEFSEKAPLELLAAKGFDYAVVPLSLEFQRAKDISEGRMDSYETNAEFRSISGAAALFELGGPVGIIDISEGEFVWCGDVAVGGTHGVYRIATDSAGPSNAFEVLSYSWGTDLMIVMNRSSLPIRTLYQIGKVCE